MKKLILFILAGIPFIALCQSGDFVIKGNLVNTNSTAKIYLVDALTLSAFDSVVVKNGEFQFKGKVKTITPAILFLTKDNTDYKKSRDGKPLYLENGTIKVSSSKEFLYTSTVSGTPTNDDKIALSEVSKIVEPINLKIAQRTKESSPEEQKSEAFIKEIGDLEVEKIEILKKAFAEFITAHPNSYISIGAIAELADFEDYEKINSLYTSLTQNIKATDAGKKFAGRLVILKNASIGSLAPNLQITDTLGNLVSISSFRGKYLLVDMWASWCGPCRKENPNQGRLYNKFKHQKFTVLGVSLDEDKKSWLTAIKKDALPWTHVSDLKGFNGQPVALFGLSSLPQNYLLDPNGIIIAKNLQGEDLSNKLIEIFGSD